MKNLTKKTKANIKNTGQIYTPDFIVRNILDIAGYNDDDILEKNVIDNSLFRDMNTALRSNGKSKSVEDFNVLDEYQTRFNETPSVLKITHDDCDLFLYEKLRKTLEEEFKNSRIIFSDNEYNLKRDKYINNREIWYIEEGYILNLWTSETRNIYANPELDIKMNIII